MPHRHARRLAHACAGRCAMAYTMASLEHMSCAPVSGGTRRHSFILAAHHILVIAQCGHRSPSHAHLLVTEHEPASSSSAIRIMPRVVASRPQWQSVPPTQSLEIATACPPPFWRARVTEFKGHCVWSHVAPRRVQRGRREGAPDTVRREICLYDATTQSRRLLGDLVRCHGGDAGLDAGSR